MAEDLRTRVRFPPPPPNKKANCLIQLAFLLLANSDNDQDWSLFSIIIHGLVTFLVTKSITGSRPAKQKCVRTRMCRKPHSTAAKQHHWPVPGTNCVHTVMANPAQHL